MRSCKDVFVSVHKYVFAKCCKRNMKRRGDSDESVNVVMRRVMTRADPGGVQAFLSASASVQKLFKLPMCCFFILTSPLPTHE